MKKLGYLLLLFIPNHFMAQPLIEQAQRHYQNASWDLAYQAYKTITDTNPYKDLYWYRYAEAAAKTDQLKEAIEAYDHTLSLNPGHGSAMYGLARCHALQGDAKNTLHWLERAKRQGKYDTRRAITDQAFKNVHQKERFLDITEQTEQPAGNRIKAWKQDLDYLVARVEKEHKNFTHSIALEKWQYEVQKIKTELPEMTDLEIIGSFMKLLALIGDGHTLVYPPFLGSYAFKALPLEFYFFEDDLYIRAATPEYHNLVGSKVEKVGSMPIEEVLHASTSYLGHDNTMHLKWIMPVALGFSDLYELIGASHSRDFISFTVQSADEASLTVSVKSGPLARDPMARFAPAHWVDLQNSKVPLWKKDPDNHFWYQYLPDKQMVYCQFNQVRDKPDQTLADFSKELFQFIRENEVEALVLDIRLNNGGNSFLNRGLIHELVKCDKINTYGKLFTIIGRRTFSAAMNLASDLEKNTATIFVGEPTGSKPNFYGEDNEFTLPNSKLTGSISSRYWQGGYTSDDRRTWIAPHLAADLSLVHYRNDTDPALDAIFTYLEAAEKN